MRTIQEIDAELAQIGVASETLQAALNAVEEVVDSNLKSQEQEDVWLARQFDGHLHIIFKLSGQNPIPADQTITALHGLMSIAKIIERVGWPNPDSFILLAGDMMEHFKKAIELHAEKHAAQMAQAGAAASPTVH